MERLEDLVLLSAAPVVHLSASGGSSGGTSLVKDIVPGPSSSSPSSVVDASGKVFFLALTTASPRMQLFVTDGTSDGTVDLTPGLEASTPLALGNTVVFTALDIATRKFGIYTSDGTAAGTRLVAALPRSSTSAGVSSDGVVYFDIFNFVSFRSELWKSDGTSTGTRLVAVIPDSLNFTVAASKVYFQGSNSLSGSELWVSDGTAAGTHIVRDINPGFGGSYPANLTAVGGTLYFTAFDAFGSPERLWKSDGTAAGTTQVDSTTRPMHLANLNGKIVFTAEDPDSGDATLWTSDGTSAGTTLVAHLPTGQLWPIAVAGGKAFFRLTPELSDDVDLWVSDGTTAGTKPIASITNADQLTVSGGRVYFTGDGPEIGNELWSSDGTSQGTAPVADIRPGSAGSNPIFLAAAGGALYFTADDGSHGRELWQSTPSTQAPATSVDEGSSFVFPGSFSDSDDAPWTATVNYGDGSGTQPLSLNADHTFTLNHQYADNGSYIVTVNVTDAAGLIGADSITVSVLNVAPAPSILGLPLSSAEGTTVTLNALVSDPSPVDTAAGFTTHWIVTKDGAFFAEGTGSSFSFKPNDNGAYLVSLSAQDKDGGVGSTSPLLLTVTNVAPIVTLLGVPSGEEGIPVSLTAAVTDPSVVDIAGGFSVTWTVTKDGALYNSGTGTSVSFNPDDDGTYVVSVSAMDKDGGIGTASATVAVANVAPTVSILNVAPAVTIQSVLATPAEGAPINLASQVSDPSPVDVAAGIGLSWAVTKDGSALASGNAPTFSFVPTDNGVYVVSVTATDKDGGFSTATQTFTVQNVAPTASILGVPAAATEGTPINLDSLLSDASPVDVAAGITASWTVTKDGSPFASGTGSSFSFVPTDNGAYVVSLTATDKDGGSSTDSRTIAVSNVAPSASILGVAVSAAEGTPINLGSQVSDPSAVDVAAGFSLAWTATRNGAPFTSGTGASFSFTPDDDGTYVVSLSATDKDGGTGTASVTISVANSAPTAAIVSNVVTGTEGSSISLGSQVSDPSPADVAAGFAIQWTVTKDGSPFASGTGSSFSFVPTDNGVYAVLLTATDRDGGSSTDTRTIAVSNVAPTASLTGDTSGVRGQTRSFLVTAADPSAADTAAGFTLQINWGDGSPLQTIAPGQSPAIGHVFQATGTYTVEVRATDKDGGVSLVTTKIVTIAAVQLQIDPADPTRTALVVGGTAGDDTIQFKRDDLGRVKVKLNGTSLGSFSPTGHLIAFGQVGDDVIQVGNNLSQPSILHGGDGDDLLMGGGGNAILVGDGGDDLLLVNDGRNLLIGGSGSDLLNGGRGDNIAITGLTAYDDNDTALIAILSEWERNATLQERVNNLKLGIAGGIAVDSTTVVNDGAGDIVLDLDGRDWLLVASTDVALGQKCRSIISYLDRPDWDSPDA